MQELITITEIDGQQIVSARELHQFLEIETPLTIQMPRMLEYGFTQSVDYQRLNKNVQMPNGATREVFEDFALTLDTAKEISMIQRSEKGKQARQYFIACEKRLKEIVPRTHLEVIDAETVSILQASAKTNVCELFREIALLTGKTHITVMQDVRTLTDRLNGEGELRFQLSYYMDINNKQQPIYELIRKEALLLASGYGAVLRLRIIEKLVALCFRKRLIQISIDHLTRHFCKVCVGCCRF